MYNFLDAKLMPKVTSNSPATDNFEATNLIHENEAIRARGYLAYTVIKPPVEIEFEFICPVNISYLVLRTTVGRQKSSGIEIFVKKSELYSSIGRSVLTKDSVVFCCSRQFSRANPPPGYNSKEQDLCFFKRTEFRNFTDAGFLKILIFRTEGRSVPCLGSVKVLGVPGKSCSITTKQTIDKLMGLVPRQESCGGSTSNKDEGIPQDFIDDLTCEIMATPMTLPSGKTVDRDTLEKHVENEKSYGRKPGDPFTGLNFTDTRKPVLNLALKSRIDMFLMQNSEDPRFFSVKRSLGGDFNPNSKRVKLDNDCEMKCCVCKSRNLLYVIPCKHYFCRGCLLKLNEFKCEDCGGDFLRNQAVRRFL